jgi:rod shape-determining protein MreD
MGYSQPRRLEERVAHEIGLALLLLGVALVQAALLPRPLGFALNLLLLLVVCQALLAGAASAARWAFYGGLSLDLCADAVLGSHALALLAAALLAVALLGRFSRGNWLVPLAGVLLGTLAYHAVMMLIWTLLIAPVNLPAYLPVVVLPDTMVVLIPALPLFLIMRWRESRRRGEVPVDVY